MILLVLILVLNFSAASSNIKLRSLSDASVKTIELHSKKANIFMIFQKDCHVCLQQLKQLNCLKSHADIYVVGTFSSEEDLRKEYKVFYSSYVGVYGDSNFKKKFKVDQKLTPQIVVNFGKRYQKLLGLVECNEILNKLNSEV